MKKLLLSAAFFFAAFTGVNAQAYDCTQAVPANSQENGFLLGGAEGFQIAADVPVYEGTSISINTIKLNLIGTYSFVNILFYDDNAGVPGTVVNTINNATVASSVVVGNAFGFDFYQVTLDVASQGIAFSSPTGNSRYWMEVVSDAAGWETTTVASVGLPAAGKSSTLPWGIQDAELVYEIIGECTGEMPIIYCNAYAGDCDYESINNVTFAGINNSTGCATGLNDYTNQVANVTQGATNQQLSVTIEADSNDYVIAAIDWDQSGTFEASEIYAVATNVSASDTYSVMINVPADAALGQTRMRVFLAWDNPGLTPCSSVQYGEVEDYTVNVSPDMSTADFFTANLSLYPNPANDIFNLSSTTSLIENIKVTDLNGRVVKTIVAGNVSEVQINISDLTTGMYFVTVNTDNGSGSTKLIKK